ncbi:coiled-coil domain-containing protein [Streptomyces oceani]|uniref:coiled-coil domain-containing protein n=1 Tax=Streptomyces oceani TaxID=1075402 RepID=UPI000872B4DF|nr:hypothetical protein [Streptomyces oceani]
MYPARYVSATAVAVATTVLLSAQPAWSDTPSRPPTPAGPDRADSDQGSERAVRPPDGRPSSAAERDRERGGPASERPDGRRSGNHGSDGRAQTGPAARPDTARDRSLSELLSRLGTLYRQTTAAATAYDKATGKLKRQRAKVDKLTTRLERASSAVDSGRSAVGELARQQYRDRGSELPATLRLLLSDHPERMLRGGHVPRHAVSQQSVRVKRLISRERQRDALTERERAAMTKQRKLSEQREQHRNRARDRLRDVERLLSSLSPAELARLRQVEGATEHRDVLPDGMSEALPEGPTVPPENPGGPRGREDWEGAGGWDGLERPERLESGKDGTGGGTRAKEGTSERSPADRPAAR